MGRWRLCISYICSSLLIGTFIFALIRMNLRNEIHLQHLRKEINDITELIVRGEGSDGEENDSSQLDQLIDLVVRKRLGFIMDDVYALKRQVEGRGCLLNTGSSSSSVGGTVPYNQIEEAVNFASVELGARIMDVDAEPLCPSNFLMSFLGMTYSSNPPIKMLQKNIDPGNCFAFKSPEAKVLVKLPYAIHVKKVGIQHISKDISPTSDIRSAPCDFKVYGKREDEDIELGAFQYQNKPTELLQLFDVKSIEENFQFLRFQFLSNHGHENYTCVYRVLVHGKLP